MTAEQFDILIQCIKKIGDQTQLKSSVFEVYTINEIAEMYKVSKRTITRAIKNKQLRAAKIGDWRIEHDDLMAYFDSRCIMKRKK